MSDILDENQIDQPILMRPLFNRTLLVVSVLVIIIGFAFRFLHWPLSGLFILSGGATISGHIISRVIWRKSAPVTITLAALFFTAAAIYFWSWSNNALFLYSGVIIIFILVEGLMKLRRSKSR